MHVTHVTVLVQLVAEAMICEHLELAVRPAVLKHGCSKSSRLASAPFYAKISLWPPVPASLVPSSFDDACAGFGSVLRASVH